MKAKILIAACLLLSSTFASSYHSSHMWQKMSEQIVTNNFGTPVLQCTWVCRANMNEQHTTITVGMNTSLCPMPMM